jgi:hypothetical protein
MRGASSGTPKAGRATSRSAIDKSFLPASAAPVGRRRHPFKEGMTASIRKSRLFFENFLNLLARAFRLRTHAIEIRSGQSFGRWRC